MGSPQELLDRVTWILGPRGMVRCWRRPPRPVPSLSHWRRRRYCGRVGACGVSRDRGSPGRPRIANSYLSGSLRPAVGRGAASSVGAPRMGGGAARQASTAEIIGPPKAARIAVDRLRPVGGQLLLGSCPAGLLRLIGFDHVCLCCDWGEPAAFEQVAVHHGRCGRPGRIAARGPDLLLKPDQPRGHLRR